MRPITRYRGDMGAGIDLVLDCSDWEPLASFWSAILGYRRDHELDAYLTLLPIDGEGPKLLLQRVSEPKIGKNRLHLDIRVDRVEDEATRLVALGARRLGPVQEVAGDSRWMVLADPEGNEFCIWRPLPEK